MKEIMAAGHVYHEGILDSGLEWLEGEVLLWEKGAVKMRAPHDTESAYEFFYGLHFASAFPDVTHWWFRSAFTQRVSLTRAVGMYPDDLTSWGYMRFINDQSPQLMWTAVDGSPPLIGVPFPVGHEQPVNLPLQIALARLVVGVVTDQVKANSWMPVTSLVARDELEVVFPESTAQIAWGFGIEGPAEGTTLRRALCELLALEAQPVS